MSVSLAILHLAGAVALLLWAVRMVRTGVERSQGANLRVVLRESSGSRWHAAATGTLVSVLLQSSTAVALLAAGFAASGVISLATGLSLMLGADLGSALVVRILSADLAWLVPVLLVLGVAVFLKARARTVRQLGRILVGVALVLVSLRMIGEASLPLRGITASESGVLVYLAGDPVLALAIGAGFTWLAHSSVAVVLIIVSFAAQDHLPADLGIYLVLGANVGSGIIAVTLTRASAIEARQIAIGNLLFKSMGAGAALVTVVFAQPDLSFLGSGYSGQLLNLHLVFNVALLLFGLPFVGLTGRVLERFVTPSPAADAGTIGFVSRLDMSIIGRPVLALANAQREILRLADLVDEMLQPLMELFETGDSEKIGRIRELERTVNEAQSSIKLYLAKISYSAGMDDEVRRGQELAQFAINLEYVGDTITKTLLNLIVERGYRNVKFSKQGWREISVLHHRVTQNFQLALNVLLSGDEDSARLLLEEKRDISRAERASAHGHLQRLSEGGHRSIATSDLHLETVRALKTINSLLASSAYATLEKKPVTRTSHGIRDSVTAVVETSSS
jgi:phosphate:Na+ symporter